MRKGRAARRDDGRPARRGQEGQNRRLHGWLTQAGRLARVVDVDVFALQNGYEVNYGLDPGGVIALINAGASATNINVNQRREVLQFMRDILDWRQCLHGSAPEGACSLAGSSAELLKRGHAGQRTSTSRQGAPDPAVRHRERVARNPEDLRLLPRHHRHRLHRLHRAPLGRTSLHRRVRRDALLERFANSEVEMFDPFKACLVRSAVLLRRAVARRRHRRRRPSRWASLFAARGTDDSHQPAHRRLESRSCRGSIRN